jgi:hypothetical protein
VTTENTIAPKCFVSYAWSSPDHVNWVIQLASDLRSNGVDVQLDKWHLREGHDAHAFMESMVSDPEVKKVIVVCDRAYAEKADQRTGGVGIESQIMSPEIYGSVQQDKFVAVVREKDENGRAFLPIFFQTRIFIDISNDAQYADGFDQLIRWCFDKPLLVPPEIGQPPSFSQQTNLQGGNTLISFERASRNPLGNADQTLALGLQFLEEFSRKQPVITPDFPESESPDDVIYQAIKDFRPTIIRVLETIDTCMRLDDKCDIENTLHSLFERLIPGLDYSAHGESVTRYHADLHRFFCHFVFVQSVRLLIDHRRFHCVDRLLSAPYLKRKHDQYTAESARYTLFSYSLESLQHRNDRLKLRRLSHHADVIKEICEGSPFDIGGFVEADFLLWLRSHLNPEKASYGWWPTSAIFASYSYGTFPVFLRAEDAEYRAGLFKILGIGNGKPLGQFFEELQAGKVQVPRWEFDRLEPCRLMNYDKLNQYLG